MSYLQNAYGFVDRGDPSTIDVTVGNLTTDGNWYDWDLSGIVKDTNAKSVLLRLTMLDDNVGKKVSFRKKGVTNDQNVSDHRTQIANQIRREDTVVALDQNNVIQYYITNTTWDAINIVVGGWWR